MFYLEGVFIILFNNFKLFQCFPVLSAAVLLHLFTHLFKVRIKLQVFLGSETEMSLIKLHSQYTALQKKHKT